jgi:hypothetical protein
MILTENKNLTQVIIPSEILTKTIKSKRGYVVCPDNIEIIITGYFTKVNRLPRKRKKKFSKNILKVITK